MQCLIICGWLNNGCKWKWSLSPQQPQPVAREPARPGRQLLSPYKSQSGTDRAALLLPCHGHSLELNQVKRKVASLKMW